MPPPGGPLDVALNLFGGLDTSLVATDLPEGLSPANNDVVFGPGFVGSRPGAKKVFANAFAGNPSATWGKKYLQANGLPLNLYIDSLGVLRTEGPVNTPGVSATLQQLSPAVSTFKSVTFDGVEYMAFSDGIHGVDIPRFYDTDLGVFDRLSKDGVGTPTGMTIVDINTQAAVNSVALSASLGGGVTAAVETGNSVLVTTAGAHGLTEIGGFILLAGVVVAGYNGVYQITAIPAVNQIIVINAGAGLGAAGAGGTLQLATITVVTATPHGLNVGDAVVLNGTGSTFNNGTNQTSNTPVPTFWDVIQVVNATTYVFSLIGLRGQGSLNTTTIAGSGAGGTSQTGGMISQGTHQVSISFLWRGGYITKPCPPISWTCAGFKQAQVSGIPTGSTGVMARILHFTGAGGANFFNIPINVQIPGNSLLFNGALAPPTIVNALIIPDNTTTNLIVDFPDNTLFAASGSDIPGNNLFALTTLAPCLGIDAYASRLFTWGEFNKVQRFLNMGFEGGVITPNQPLGWGTFGAGGALVAAPNGFGLAWQITGDGTANDKGTLTQTAYQNYLFQPIIQPSEQYSFYMLAKCSAGGLAGNVKAKLSSASTGFTATATIAINTISSTTPTFVSAAFSAPMPAAIPSDLVFSVFENGLNNNATVTIDELMVVFTNQPYRSTVMRASYVNNPESFDGITGDIGPNDDPNPIRDTFQILETLTILTSKRRHNTQDNGGEPATWSVPQREDNAGAASIHSATTGTSWAAWISDTGKALALRITAGGDSFKISREMKTYFKAANMAQKHRSWLCNVDDESAPGAGIMFMGVPLGEAGVISTGVLDYFESDTAGDIQSNRPLHIGFTGKMLTTDLGRKWTVWNLPLAFGAVLARSGGIDQFCAGSGANAQGAAFGNVYTFDATKFTDDDYGQISPSYTTYFFVNHDMEQQLQLGGKRKLFGAAQTPMTMFITGTGILQITPLANTVGNKWGTSEVLKPWALSQNQADDIELTVEVSARRCAFQVSVIPDTSVSPTDVNFLLSHMSVPILAHPVSKIAGQSKSYA